MAKNDDWEDLDSDSDWEDVAPQPVATSKVESGVRGLAQGASFGFADEITGAGEALLDKLTKGKDFSDAYSKRRDESRANYKKAKEDNPMTYGAGEIGGAVATSLIPIGTAARGAQAVKALTNTQKAKAYLMGLGKMGATGAGLGGLSAAGASEGETLSDVAKDTGKGMALGLGLGAATGAALPIIRSGAQKAGGVLKDFAEDRAFKAAGAIKKDFAKVGKQGADRANEIGRELLDDGHINWLSSVDDVSSSIDRGIADKSKFLNDTIERADEIAQNTSLNPAQQSVMDAAKFNPQQIAARLKDELKAKYPGVPESKLQPALDEIDSWLGAQIDDMSAMGLQDAKVSMNRFLKDSDFYRNPNTGIAREGLTSVRGAFKEGIEKKGDAAAEILGDATGQIRDTNKSLGNLLEARDAAVDAQAREGGNRFFGLTDNMLGAAGGTLEGVRQGDLDGALKGAAVGFLGGKAIRKFGAPLSAVASDRASKWLMSQPGMAELAVKNPAAFKALANDLGRRMTPQGGVPMSAENEYSGNEKVSPEEARERYVNGN